MSIEFTDPGTTQYVSWGAPAGAVGLTTFSISFWHNPDSVGATSECTLFSIWDGTGTDTDQYIVIYRPDTAEQKIRFDAHWSTTNGNWATTSSQLTVASVWYHIVVTYDGSLTANNPAIYVNGSSKAVTRSTAPVGTFRTGTSVNLTIGEDTAAGFSPDGKIADLRIYNAVLTSSQVNALYSAGANTPNFDTNLVFNAPLTNATALSGSSFNGFTLTSSQKLIDRIGCAQGTPSGSPLGSTTEPS